MGLFGFAKRADPAAPVWASALAAIFALLALAALAQGFVDFTIPMLLGGEPFGFTRALVDASGASALFGAILLHNLGLALLVPGCGFIAARFEREDRSRRLIAPLLIGASAFAILLGVGVVMQGAVGANRTFALTLAAGEGLAILSVGLAGARELRRFRFRRPDAHGLALALRSMRAPILLSGVFLVALAALETTHLLGLA